MLNYRCALKVEEEEEEEGGGVFGLKTQDFQEVIKGDLSSLLHSHTHTHTHTFTYVIV